MDYVIDANVLMSILISGKSSYLTLTRYFHFHIPAYALWELEAYQHLIFKKGYKQVLLFDEFLKNI